jgi:DNA processing protein
MSSTRQIKAWIRLSLTRALGRNWNLWLAELAAENLALEDFLELPEHQARRYLQNWPSVARALRLDASPPGRVDEVLERIEREGIRLIAITDAHYPACLLADLAFDAPTFLYVKGHLTHLRAPTIALVGTRRSSTAGLETARAYAAALVREGVHIVSGDARGVDLASHEGALAAGGTTAIVASTGIFVFMPAPSLGHSMTPQNTLLISQFSPDAHGNNYQPVRRDPTIASLADGLIVVESGLKSGTAYEFRAARRFHKPVWSVIYPEPVPDSASGNHSLLAAGALPLEPGPAGAERSAAAIVQRLRESRAAHPRDVKWPPSEHPGQMDLFANL